MTVVLHQYLDCCVGCNNLTGYFQQIVKLLSVANNVWPLSVFPYVCVYILYSLVYIQHMVEDNTD